MTGPRADHSGRSSLRFAVVGLVVFRFIVVPSLDSHVLHPFDLDAVGMIRAEGP